MRGGGRLRAALAGTWLLLATASTAQIHHHEPAPWSAMADSASRRGVIISYADMPGTESGWRGQRVGLLLRFPLGEGGLLYLRGSYVRMETRGRSLFDRWPELLADDPDAGLPAEEADDALRNAFGPPELGTIVPLTLPLLGPGAAAFQVGLPFGKESLYPLSSRALAMSIDWRRADIAVGPLVATGRVGWEISLDASGDVFAPEAFPDGLRWGAELGVPWTDERGVRVAWSARELEADRHQRRAELQAWLPLASRHRVWVEVLRELGVRRHRLADWTVQVALDLRGLLGDDPEPRKMP
jgi:hypothetical protein